MATRDDLDANAEFIRLADTYVEVGSAKQAKCSVLLVGVCQQKLFCLKCCSFQRSQGKALCLCLCVIFGHFARAFACCHLHLGWRGEIAAMPPACAVVSCLAFCSPTLKLPGRTLGAGI